jgi:hypothetical protein
MLTGGEETRFLDASGQSDKSMATRVSVRIFFILGPRLDCKIFLNLMNSTTFVLFGKYCLIVDQPGSRFISRFPTKLCN